MIFLSIEYLTVLRDYNFIIYNCFFGGKKANKKLLFFVQEKTFVNSTNIY